LNLKHIKIFISQIIRNYNGLQYLNALSHYSRWRRSLFKGATPLSDEQPWITFDAIQYLEDKVESNHRVFEFGGGGSTIFFLTRCQLVVTIEHNTEWFNILKKQIEHKQLNNWIGNLIEPEEGNLVESPNASNPDHYSSGGVRDVNFRKYVSSISSYPDEYFDIILVDGRSRPACIKHAASKLKKYGLIILDNADRSYYLGTETLKIINKFSLVLSTKGPSPYATFFTQTNIWKK
jgi:predicted O-methyltransferase YrrM